MPKVWFNAASYWPRDHNRKPLRALCCNGNSQSMPQQPDNYESTEADIDMVVEEATGKSVKPANLAEGILSLRQRLVELEAEKSNPLSRLDGMSAVPLTQALASSNQSIATARERLRHYETQLGQQN